MSESDDSTVQNRLQTIYADGEAHVEDFRIRPVAVESDHLEMKLLMRIGGGEAVYYLNAMATYSDDEDNGHHVTVRRRGAGIVDAFETGIITASPEDTFDAVQALHETYIGAAQDWYDYAVAADEAGDE